ncbi:MAG: hydroxymyristoyl-ACP dehydratase [Gammaproteobacteria bacterium]
MLIAGLIPHTGSMCLLESVEHWDESGVRCATRTHLDAANPLRGADGLLALHLVEYGAQATAVHGALRSGKKAPPGVLTSVKDVRFGIERIDDIAAPLQVEARVQFANDSGSLYEFSVSADGRLLAKGRVSVMNTPAP